MNKKERLKLEKTLLANAELEAEDVYQQIALGEPTVQEVKDGVWQYLVDHSSFTDLGRLRIVFYVDSRDNFWKRCGARINGTYKRNDVGEIDEKLKLGTGLLAELKHLPKRERKLIIKNDKHARYKQSTYEIVKNIEKNGSLLDRLALWGYRKLKNYIFKDVNKNLLPKQETKQVANV